MRVVASALATVALAGQVMSFAHLVLVRHVRCVEHGELVEVGREKVIALSAHLRQPTNVLTEASTDATHGHDHCLLAPMRRDRLAAGTPAILDAFHIDAYCTIGVPATDEVARPVAVISLAPKNSPPVA